MKRLGTCAVLLSMIAAVVVSAGYLRSVRMQRVVPATVPPDERIFRARLLFAGDVMAHLPQLTAARRSDGTHDFFGQFRLVKPRFDAADLVVVNLETTLSAAAPHTGYPCFRTPSSLARALRRAGVDVAVTANNHCCDGGARGIGATLAALDDAGLRHTGTFVDSLRHGADHPLRLAANGIRFALFNYTYGTNGLPVPTGTTVNRIDTTVIARDLAAVDRGSVDCVIAFVHWGNEYERRPDSEQRMLAGFLRRHGADLVVGSHPHVVQPFEQDSTGAVLLVGKFRLEPAAALLRRRTAGRSGSRQARCGGRADDALCRTGRSGVGCPARLPDSAARSGRYACDAAPRTCGL